LISLAESKGKSSKQNSFYFSINDEPRKLMLSDVALQAISDLVTGPFLYMF